MKKRTAKAGVRLPVCVLVCVCVCVWVPACLWLGVRVCVCVRKSINMQSYADALSAKGYRSFGFDTDVEMDMDMGLAVRRIEKRKGGEWTKYKHTCMYIHMCIRPFLCASVCTLITGQQSIYSVIACSSKCHDPKLGLRLGLCIACTIDEPPGNATAQSSACRVSGCVYVCVFTAGPNSKSFVCSIVLHECMQKGKSTVWRKVFIAYE